MIDRPLVPGRNVGTIICPVGKASDVVARAWLSVRCDGGGRIAAYFQKAADSDQPPPGAGDPWMGPFRHAARPWHELPDGTEFIQYDVTANGFGALCVELLAK